MTPECICCGAKFGPKFERFTCAHCQGDFCEGHIITREYLRIDNDVKVSIGPNGGLCYSCLFLLWGKADSSFSETVGLGARLKKATLGGWDWLKRQTGFSKAPTERITVLPGALDKMAVTRAWAVFKHQQDLPYDFLTRDMAVFARMVAVSCGRASEHDLTLNDVYRLTDWLRSHPNIPYWLQGFSWNTIEDTKLGAAYFWDVWHVASAAVALSNPSSGLPWVAYHLSDRIVEEKTGNGLLLAAYEKMRDRLGLNINPKKAVAVYLAGHFILQLYRRDNPHQSRA